MEAKAYGRRIIPRRISIEVSPHEADLIRRVRETPFGEVTAKIRSGVLVLFTITRTDFPSEGDGMSLADNIID